MKIGRRKIKDACVHCGVNPQLCICSLIPTLDLKTRVLLVIHAREMQLTTNTGRLAIESLLNSEMKIRGEGREALDLSTSLLANYQPALFYPAEDAVDLTANWREQFDKPILLIVPDGSWRQAGKVHTRHPELASFPRVMIRAINESTRHLRKEPSSYGMSTLEAIAKALGVLEGPAVEQKLMTLYQAKLDRTLRSRTTPKEKLN